MPDKPTVYQQKLVHDFFEIAGDIPFKAEIDLEEFLAVNDPAIEVLNELATDEYLRRSGEMLSDNQPAEKGLFALCFLYAKNLLLKEDPTLVVCLN